MANKSAATSPVEKSDTYFDALKKHLPAGLLATYLATDGMLAGIPSADAKIAMSWVVFALCLIACPFWMYLYEANKNKLQIVFACISFVILVFAAGGPLAPMLDADQLATSKIVTSVIAAIFTGLVAPLVTKATAPA